MLKKENDSALKLRMEDVRQQKKMKPLRQFLNAFSEPVWQMGVDRLMVRLKNVRAQRKDFMKLSELELKVILAREDEIQQTISLPNSIQTMLSVLEAKNAKLGDRIAKRKGRN